MKPESKLRMIAAVLVWATASGCDEPVPFDINRGNPVMIQVVSDTSGISPTNVGAEIQVSVLLAGSDRGPVADWPVRWRSSSSSPVSTSPQGSVSSETTTTDETGVATVTWTLGESAETYHLEIDAQRVLVANASGSSPISPRVGPDISVRAQ